MRQLGSNKALSQQRRASAFTLAEVVIAIAIAGVVFAGILSSSVQMTKRAEWSGQSLAAQALAIQQLEQARSAVWDNTIAKNEMTNLNLIGWSYNTNTGIGRGYSAAVLDLPIAGTNSIMATNFVTITQLNNITGSPGVRLQMVQVDTVWIFRAYGGVRLQTNTVVTYFAPDNVDASNL